MKTAHRAGGSVLVLAVLGWSIVRIFWALLEGLFQVYVAIATVPYLFGVVGGVILVLLWLYGGSLILLIGIVVLGVPKRMQTSRFQGNS